MTPLNRALPPAALPARRTRPLALAALGLATALLLAACSSKTERIDEGLRKSAGFARGADWDKASVEVRNVLQIDPKNAPAYLLAAHIEEGRGDLPRAFANYSKAAELLPDSIEAQLGLARLYLMTGDLVRADTGIARVLAAEPGHVQALTLQAASLAGHGDIAGALARTQALLAGGRAVPVETRLMLAGLYLRQGNAAKALAVVETALATEGRTLPLLKVAAEIAGGIKEDSGAQDKALGWYREAAEKSPKDAGPWNAWASFHAGRNELDAAERVLRAAIAAQPDDTPRSITLLEFVASRRGFEAAEREFKSAITARPKDARLRFGLAELYRANGRADDAQRVLGEVVALGRDEAAGLEARVQLAIYRLASGQPAAARVLLDEVLKVNPRDNKALLLRARLLLADGQARDAILDLRSVARDQPAAPKVIALLAQAHRAAAEPRLARDVVAEAVKFKPDSAELRLMLAADHADAHEFDAANAEIDEAIRLTSLALNQNAALTPRLAPTLIQGYMLKSQVALVRKDVSGAEQALLALKARLPLDPAGALRLGQFYAGQNKPAPALKEYDAAARLAPDAGEPLLLAVTLLASQKREAEADNRVSALLAARPALPLGWQLRGELALARKDLPTALAAFEKALSLAPDAPVGYLNLARAQEQGKNLPGALATLQRGEQAAAGTPDGGSPLVAARAELLARAGRHDEAITLYEGLAQRAPENDTYANNLAYMLLQNRGDPASLARALQLTQRFAGSNNAAYLDTLGWVRFRLGDAAKAVPLLERAVALAPTAPQLQLHLGMALLKNGEAQRGRDHVNKAIASKAVLPELAEAQRLLG